MTINLKFECLNDDLCVNVASLTKILESESNTLLSIIRDLEDEMSEMKYLYCLQKGSDNLSDYYLTELGTMYLFDIIGSKEETSFIEIIKAGFEEARVFLEDVMEESDDQSSGYLEFQPNSERYIPVHTAVEYATAAVEVYNDLPESPLKSLLLKALEEDLEKDRMLNNLPIGERPINLVNAFSKANTLGFSPNNIDEDKLNSFITSQLQPGYVQTEDNKLVPYFEDCRELETLIYQYFS